MHNSNHNFNNQSGVATRDGFGEGLLEIAKWNERVIGLCADLTESTRMSAFARQFSDRFFNVGIAEQNMVGMAAGLASVGFIPFIATYAVFLGRAWDQIRVSLCLNKANVKIIGTHAGLTVGPDGATAQGLEDISMLRALPNLTIVQPCDVVEAKKAVSAITEISGPVYLRLERDVSPIITKKSDPFVIGRAEMIRKGKDVTVIACGSMVATAIQAAESLQQVGVSVRVVNMHTIKPIDVQMIETCAKDTKAIVVAEHHQMYGGLGAAVAEVLALHCPTPMEQVAVRDTFGESGQPSELLKKYHLLASDIEKAVVKVIKRK